MARRRQVTAGLARFRSALRFRTSGAYWEERYAAGGTSGAGSYGAQAEYKARFLNSFVSENGVQTVIELGCGDGNQLRLADYPAYLGVDVSHTAIRMCLDAFREDSSKSFLQYDPTAFADPARFVHADLALSLDVVFHLVEDPVFETYMGNLFGAADRFVIIYATDTDARHIAPHVRRRVFSDWVAVNAPEWRLLHLEPASVAEYQDFHVFARSEPVGAAEGLVSQRERRAG